MHTGRRVALLATAATIVGALVLGSAGAAAGAPPKKSGPPSTMTPAACAQLADLRIPAKKIGLPTRGADIATASWDSATASCAVTGWIRAVTAPQDMQFRVNLPARWNKRALHFGGGGYNGSLVTATGAYIAQPLGQPTALAQGWVTYGSDGGHQGAGFDGTFQLDPELFLTYGQQSVKKAHDAAFEVVRTAYRTLPSFSYFIGGSQGGHEALDAAARYPKDYDGVIANYPVYNVTMHNVGAVKYRDALQADGGAAHLNPGELATITSSVLGQCDGLDGAVDGIAGDVAACADVFDPDMLLCADDAQASSSDTCLSSSELRAAIKIASDYDVGIEIEGNSISAKSALFQGAPFQGFAGFGAGPRPSGLTFDVFNAVMRYAVLGDPAGFDPYTVDPLDHADRIQEVGAIQDVTDVSLRKFRALGGKAILTHGTVDDKVSPYSTRQYYAALQEEFGKRLGSFVKFYEIPGWGHGEGAFNAKFDGLDAIVDWVERGQAPRGLVAVDGNPGADRSRPMCEFPAWPEYRGYGSLSQASSFRCTKP